MKLARIKQKVDKCKDDIGWLQLEAEQETYFTLEELARQYQTSITIDCKLDLLKEHLAFETECKNPGLLAELEEIRGFVLTLEILLEDGKLFYGTN